MVVEYKNAPLESILRSAENRPARDRSMKTKNNLVVISHQDGRTTSIRKLAIRKSLQGWAESRKALFGRGKRCSRALLENDWITFLSYLDHVVAWSILDFAVSEGKTS